MLRHLAAAGWLAGVLVIPALASAQPATWPGRVFLNAGGGLQGTSTSATTTVGFISNAERSTFDARYDIRTGPVIDVRGGVRVWRTFVVGIGVSHFSRTVPTHVVALMPHPFYLQRPRTVTGDASDISRDELGVHLEAGWVLPVSERMDLDVFAGPSVVRLRQDLVSFVTANDTYPYDTATYAGASATRKSKAVAAFNVGLDLSYLFAKHVGFGALVRYTRASATLTLPGLPGDAGSQVFSFDAGGLQFGAGARLRF